MIYIIGSGPAGVSCAYALLEKGLSVTMLDTGIMLEPQQQEILNLLENKDELDPLLLHKLQGQVDTSAHQPLKLVYGSDYPYKEVNLHMPVTATNVLCRPSFAQGGLSSVWGAALMPYLNEDIADWPISIQDLAPYYEKVLCFMPQASADIEVETKFPFYKEEKQHFNLSPQASYLFESFKKNKKILNKSGFFLESSRLAVQFSQTKDKHKCTYCGLCMHGCPYQLIYSTAFTLEKLKENKNFCYIPDIVVDKVEESKEKIIIHSHERKTYIQKSFIGTKVFLACGTISTTKIMLASMKLYNHKLFIKDSQHFMLPCLLHKRVKHLNKEKLHTLSQLYIEVFDKKVTSHSIHLQLYTYMDFFEKELQRKFGMSYKFLRWPLTSILERMVLIKGYLHSDISPHVSIELKKGTPDTISLERIENFISKKTTKKIMYQLLRNQHLLHFVPLIPFRRITIPGAANHYGSTFPMRLNPNKFETDTLGRPYGFTRLHLVDASVFPSIPAQSPTLTIMANAYRIGSTVEL